MRLTKILSFFLYTFISIAIYGQSSFIVNPNRSECNLPEQFEVVIADYCTSCNNSYETGSGTNTVSLTPLPGLPTHGKFTTTDLDVGSFHVFENSNSIGTLNISVTDPGVISISTDTSPPWGCEGTVIRLTANGGKAGTTYSWEKNNVFLQNGSYIDVTTVEGTTDEYEVTGTEPTCNTIVTSESISVIGTNEVAQVGSPSPSGSSHCQGDVSSTTFTATSPAHCTNGLTWDIFSAGSSSIDNTGKVTWDPNFNGTATIRVTAHGECSSSTDASVNYTVNALPANQIVTATNTQLCTGTTTDFGLEDSEAGRTYRLYRNGNATVLSTVGSASGGSLDFGSFGSIDTYYVEASYNGCEVTMANTITLSTLNPGSIGIDAPGASSSNCPSESLTLTATGGSGYSWTKNNVFFSSATSITISPTEGFTDTYEVTGNESNCGQSRSDNIDITGYRLVSVSAVTSAADDYCADVGTTQFTASVSDGVGTWSSDPTSATTNISSNGLVTWATGYVGEATIIFSATGSCSSTASSQKTVELHAVPSSFSLVPNASDVCPGGSTYLTLQGSETGVTYALFKDANSTPSETKTGTGGDLVWTGYGVGAYRIEASRTNGLCTTITMNNGVDVNIGQLTPGTISSSITATNFNPPVTGNTLYACDDALGELTLSFSGFSADWTWYDGPSVIPGTANLTTYQPTVSGNYSVQFTNIVVSAVCRSAADVNDPNAVDIHIESVPIIPDVTYNFLECDAVRANALSDPGPGYTIHWYDPAQNTLGVTGASFDFTGLAVGTHNYLVKAHSDTYNCTSASFGSITVTIEGATIDITAPVAGDIWWIGSTNSISYSTNLTTEPMDFFLSGNGPDVAIPDPANWMIPSNQAISSNYKIKAVSCGQDFYPGDFSIGDPTLHPLSDPVNGELFLSGQSNIIQWPDDPGYNFEIYHRDDSNAPLVTIDLNPSTSTSGSDLQYAWSTPAGMEGNYQILVKEANDLITYLADVEIVSQIAVTKPNAAETFGKGEYLNIRWTGGSVSGNFDYQVDLLKGATLIFDQSIGSVTGTTDIWWTVPQNLVVGQQYKIRVTQSLDVAASGTDVQSALTADFFDVIVCPGSGSSPSTDQNFVKTFRPKTELSTCVSLRDDPNVVLESISYFDGSGRSSQQIIQRGSPDQLDMVSPITYDDFGRNALEHLPFAAGTDGAYNANWQTDITNFYSNTADIAQSAFHYQENEYELSSLSRPLKTYAPGDPWAKASGNKPISFAYGTKHIY